MPDITIKQVWLGSYQLALAHAMAKQTMEERCDAAEMHEDARLHADKAVEHFEERFHFGEDD